MAEELLRKETVTLPDITRILGARPFPMKESLKEYFDELVEREEEDKVKKEEKDKKEEEEKNSANTPGSNVDNVDKHG